MTIKHLVISGGGPSLLQVLGMLQILINEKMLNNVETVYGTSAGAFIAVIFCLQFEDLNIVKDYLIDRPWHEVFTIQLHQIFELYQTKGIFDKTIIETVVKPLFLSKDISLQITLQEFYEFSKIDLHIFAFEINSFQTVDFSHSTHPTIPLIDVIFMSSSLPILMRPTMLNQGCYIDGGVLENYPLEPSLHAGHNHEEILGICNDYSQGGEADKIIESFTMIDYILFIFFRFLDKIRPKKKEENVKEIRCKVQKLSFSYYYSFINSTDLRREYYEKGVELAKEFMEREKVNFI